MTELNRFTAPLTGPQLRELLTRGVVPKTVALDVGVDLQPVHQAIEALPRKGGGLRPATDAELAPVVHASLAGLPRRTLLDNRFWHWLSSVEFQTYVLERWALGVDLGLEEPLSPSQAGRFLGNPGMHGFGRNALARLFWTAEAMGDASEGYQSTKAFFAKQDLVLGVIEREFGLIPEVLRACTRYFADKGADGREGWRESLRRLNLRASTVQLEGASEQDIIALLEPSRQS
jgi:Family of unknown function (DUF6339)